jgi:IS1 family transposase
VLQSGLLNADETPWPEQGAQRESLWLWVFTSAYVTLYYVSHRGQALVKNLLAGYTGVLMSDGWQAYRWLGKRLRCWAHLKRKGVGLTESLNGEARGFGQDVLTLWQALREAVRQAREGPADSIREAFEARLSVFRSRCEALRASPHKAAASSRND